MRNYTKGFLLVLIVGAFGFMPVPGYTGLVDNGNGLIYDTDLNITWYDFTYAKGVGAYWYQAMDWASGLTVNGVGGWRLPSSLNPDGSGPCGGYNCTSSEMGHLYYTELALNAWPTGPPFGVNPSNQYPFTKLEPSVYWSGTGVPYYYPNGAWGFAFGFGSQGWDDYDTYYALAVHDGNVGGAPVPIPAAILLLGSGLIGLIGLRRKFKQCLSGCCTRSCSGSPATPSQMFQAQKTP